MCWVNGKPTEPGFYKIRGEGFEIEIEVIEYSGGLCYKSPGDTYTFELEYLDPRVQHCKISGPTAQSADRQDIVVDFTQPCIICNRHLSSMFGTWRTNQPDGGREIQLTCSYGSRFDSTTNMYGSIYSGLICDGCAEGLIKKMRQIQ